MRTLSGAKAEEGGGVSIQLMRPLFDEARSGDDDALWELIDRFQPLIFSVARRRLDSCAHPLDPADEVDEIRILALAAIRTKFATFTGELEQFPGWIRVVTWRVGSRVISKRSNELANASPVEGFDLDGIASVSNDTDPVRRAMARLELDALTRCLARLTEEESALIDILRHHCQGKTVEEISSMPLYQYDQSTIRKKMKRARRLLRACMESRAQ